jgi:hypothetical protein
MDQDQEQTRELMQKVMKVCDVVVETLRDIGDDPHTSDLIRAKIGQCRDEVTAICTGTPDPVSDPVPACPAGRGKVLQFRRAAQPK